MPGSARFLHLAASREPVVKPAALLSRNSSVSLDPRVLPSLGAGADEALERYVSKVKPPRACDVVWCMHACVCRRVVPPRVIAVCPPRDLTATWPP